MNLLSWRDASMVNRFALLPKFADELDASADHLA
jgi:hypothetical protein